MTDHNKTDRRRSTSPPLKNDLLTGILSKGECVRLLDGNIIFGGTVFVLDFDDLSGINERFGKTMGDDALKAFAEDLKKLCRDTDVVARIGGDEFLVFMPLQQLTKTEIRSVIKRYRKCIQEHLLYGEHGECVQKGAKVGALVAPSGKYTSYSEVMALLNGSLYSKENEYAKEVIVDDKANSVYTELFPTKVQNALSVREINATLKAMNKAFYTAFFIRLHDHSFVKLQETKTRKINNQDTRTIEQIIQDGVEKYVDEEYQIEMRVFGNLSTVVERMKDKDQIQMEYRDKKLGWSVARFVAVNRKDGNVNEVMFLLSNISEAKERDKRHLRIQKAANELLTNAELLFVGLIDPSTGSTTVELSLKNPETVGKTKDYADSMKKERTYVVDPDHALFTEQTQLEEVKTALENQARYTVSAILKTKKKERRLIKYHYTRFDDKILCATEDVTEQSSFDETTGYYNFMGFRLHVRSLIEQHGVENYAVLNFNISNFKAINNFYSYDTGNWLLGEVARQIMASKLNVQALCRENADNYFALCRKKDLDYETIEELCHMEIVGEDDTRDSLQLFCGIYPCEPDYELIQDMCDKSRLARRRAERERGVDVVTFDKSTQAQYLDGASILAAIPKAIRNEELEVYYQPIFDAKTQEVASAEALVRWNHPQKGLLAPGVFVPAIEKTELIAEVDRYVAEKVAKDLNLRLAQGKRIVPVSVNLSRYDFLRDYNLEQMKQVIRNNPELSEVLRIEITESGFINIPKNGQAFIDEMKAYGVKIMIDDFGTGFSSLASITEHPCDMIKLDMSFASSIGKNPQMEKIIIAIIYTAHELGVTVIAEGVETKDQYEFLRKHRCDYIQGYYFSKPIPKHELEELLK